MKEAKTMEEKEEPSLNFIIGQYVERKDINGLAEYFRAYVDDSIISLSKIRNEAIEEAIEAIPKEEEEVPGYHHADLGARGFNRCRSQTLAALTKLKGK